MATENTNNWGDVADSYPHREPADDAVEAYLEHDELADGTTRV